MTRRSVRSATQLVALIPSRTAPRTHIGELRLYDSYHCSRYNTNTGVLTTEMFEAVFAKVRVDLDAGRATGPIGPER